MWYEHQQVNLGPGCDTGTTPLHEIMHALGFWHEQQRGDALDHIDINRENCKMTDSSFNINFNFQSWVNSGHPYDYDSVMHYQ